MFMPQTSFEIDEKTAEALENLKKVYGVSSKAAVLKRALALAVLAAQYADKDHNLRILSSDKGKEREVAVSLR
jgi:hypothetical protein